MAKSEKQARSTEEAEIKEENLLKSLGLLENDVKKGFGKAPVDDESSDEDESYEDDEDETDEVSKADAAKKGKKGTAGLPKKLKDANGGLSKQGNDAELSKSFSDIATDETKEVLDTTPFFVDLREFLDGQAGALGNLQKSLADIDERVTRDDRIIKSLAGATIALGREIARQGAFLNDLGKRLNMPVQRTPSSVIAKSEVQDRDIGGVQEGQQKRDPNAISKSEFNNALDAMINEGKIDHRVVISYETGGALPTQVRDAVAQRALSMRNIQ